MKKEKKSVPGPPALMVNVQQANRNLVENERFVKKLELQIDIIKKIIDPGKSPTLVEEHKNDELQRDN